MGFAIELTRIENEQRERSEVWYWEILSRGDMSDAATLLVALEDLPGRRERLAEDEALVAKLREKPAIEAEAETLRKKLPALRERAKDMRKEAAAARAAAKVDGSFEADNVMAIIKSAARAVGEAAEVDGRLASLGRKLDEHRVLTAQNPMAWAAVQAAVAEEAEAAKPKSRKAKAAATAG